MATVKGGVKTAVKGLSEKGIVQKTLIGMKGQLGAALPEIMTPERFVRLTLTAMSKNPKLYDCTQGSLIGAIFMAAQLGLEPNTPLGQAYLIPYWNNRYKCYECQFQVGYKGMITLAYRSGKVTDIWAADVRENDEFRYELGLNPILEHKPVLKDRGDVIAYYAVWHTKDGGHGFAVMSREDILEHKNRFSKADQAGFSPWSTNFDEMAKKTVLKKALKYAPMAAEFARAMASDGAVKSIVDTKDIPDMLDQPDEMDYADAAEVQDQPAAAIEDKDSSIQAPAMELQTEDVKVPQK